MLPTLTTLKSIGLQTLFDRKYQIKHEQKTNFSKQNN